MRGAICALGLFAAGCSRSAAPVEAPVGAPFASGPPIAFSYEALDGKPLSSDTVAGRITVIGFITTYDMASQAEVRFLLGLGRHHTPRLNVAFIVLESRDNRPLVDAFVAALGIPYPVALADPETISGHGSFAGLHHVPSVIILDQQGREAWRHIGLADEAKIEQAVRAVEQARKASGG
jgi:hypothetical protein